MGHKLNAYHFFHCDNWLLFANKIKLCQDSTARIAATAWSSPEVYFKNQKHILEDHQNHTWRIHEAFMTHNDAYGTCSSDVVFPLSACHN